MKKAGALFLVLSMVFVLIFAGCADQPKAADQSASAPASSSAAAPASSAAAPASDAAAPASASGAFAGKSSDEYYMVTFISGIEYWKGCYKGFQEAGKQLGITTQYTGGQEYDVNQEVTALEQVIAKSPAGIAVTCINPDALKPSIDKAIEAGIPVVTFDADSPQSKRYSFLATGNVYAGEVAGKSLAEAIGGKGEVGIIYAPGQLNIEQRVQGFKKVLQESYPDVKVVAEGNGELDQTKSASVMSGFIQAHPNLAGVFATDATAGVGAATAVKEANKVGGIKIISFDTEKGTLDAIKEGVIYGSIAQGTYTMGYQSMMFLYELKNNLLNPVDGWQKAGINPLPPSVDTGVNVVTKDTADAYYSK
jgi:ribose transport system substrate-binding protein